MEEIIEINFRLDRFGRTSAASSSGSNNTTEKETVLDSEDDNKKEKKNDKPNTADNNINENNLTKIEKLRYESRAVMLRMEKGFPFDKNNRKHDSLDENECDDDRLNDESSSSLLDNILFDCEIADCGLMPRTFWFPGQGMKPRCSLEQMALDIFNYHVRKYKDTRRSLDDHNDNNSDTENRDFDYYDPSKSGAEWWVQIRPSPPKIGRYSMHMKNQQCDENIDNSNKNNISESDFICNNGISFHWDKDEDLRLLTGGSLYIHPHLSTVTYLTSLGAPTLALNCRVNNYTGQWIVPTLSKIPDDTINHNNNHNHYCDENNNNKNEQQQQQQSTTMEAFISWPKRFKHLSFDGRYLHAAPPDLMEPGTFQKQCQYPRPQQQQHEKSESTPRTKMEEKKRQRRYRRVTFLVNIWLNYKPINIEPFPETMVDKLSGYSSSNKINNNNIETIDSNENSNYTSNITTQKNTDDNKRVYISFMEEESSDKRNNKYENKKEKEGKKTAFEEKSMTRNIRDITLIKRRTTAVASKVPKTTTSKKSAITTTVKMDQEENKKKKDMVQSLLMRQEAEEAALAVTAKNNGNQHDSTLVYVDDFDVNNKDSDKSSKKSNNIEVFEWPLGDIDSNEFLQATLPIQAIRDEQPLPKKSNEEEGVTRTSGKDTNGNIRIRWLSIKEYHKGKQDIDLDDCRKECGNDKTFIRLYRRHLCSSNKQDDDNNHDDHNAQGKNHHESNNKRSYEQIS